MENRDFQDRPRAKRLEILNRFRYNPFEEEYGGNQCELWKKLMAQEIELIKLYSKDH